MRPLELPLLTPDLRLAEAALAALIDRLAGDRPVTFRGLPRNGAFARLLASLSSSGWTSHTVREPSYSHGVHLMPEWPRRSSVRIVTDVGEAAAAVERLVAAPDPRADRRGDVSPRHGPWHGGGWSSGHRARAGWGGSRYRPDCPSAKASWAGSSVSAGRRRPTLRHRAIWRKLSRITWRRPLRVAGDRLSGLGCAPLITDRWSIEPALSGGTAGSVIAAARPSWRRHCSEASRPKTQRM